MFHCKASLRPLGNVAAPPAVPWMNRLEAVHALDHRVTAEAQAPLHGFQSASVASIPLSSFLDSRPRPTVPAVHPETVEMPGDLVRRPVLPHVEVVHQRPIGLRRRVPAWLGARLTIRAVDDLALGIPTHLPVEAQPWFAEAGSPPCPPFIPRVTFSRRPLRNIREKTWCRIRAIRGIETDQQICPGFVQVGNLHNR